MTYILDFKNSRGERREIARSEDRQAVQRAMYDFLNERKYTASYCRMWLSPEGETVCDVGSYSEFFYIREEA